MQLQVARDVRDAEPLLKRHPNGLVARLAADRTAEDRFECGTTLAAWDFAAGVRAPRPEARDEVVVTQNGSGRQPRLGVTGQDARAKLRHSR